MAATTISRPPRIAANPPPTLARFALFIGFCSFAVGLVERIISSNKTSRICVGCLSAWAGQHRKGYTYARARVASVHENRRRALLSNQAYYIALSRKLGLRRMGLTETQAKREGQGIISQPLLLVPPPQDQGEEAPSASLSIATKTSRSQASSMWSLMAVTSSPRRQTPRRSSTVFRSPCSAYGCGRSRQQDVLLPSGGVRPEIFAGDVVSADRTVPKWSTKGTGPCGPAPFSDRVAL